MTTAAPESWREVARDIAAGLRLAAGFVLQPVALPDELAADTLRDLLKKDGFTVLLLKPSGQDWLYLSDRLRRISRYPDPSVVVMVYGTAPLDPDQIRGLDRLNRARDSVIQELGRPLLWCGPPSFLAACWEMMPDFWSIRAFGEQLRGPEPVGSMGDRQPRAERRDLLGLPALLQQMFTPGEFIRFCSKPGEWIRWSLG